MRRRLELLLPVAVLVGFVAAAVLVAILVDDARERGLEALEESTRTEVQTLAASYDAGYAGQLASGRVLIGFDFEATVGSQRDAQTLAEVNDLLGFALEAGLYLTNLEGVVTNGINIDASLVGQRADLPGLDAVLALPTFAQGFGAFLPAGPGLTTERPQLALVVPILDALPDEGGTAIGAVISETPVASDNQLNAEVRSLRRGETGAYRLYDSAGTVLASSDPTEVAQPVATELGRLDPGLHRVDGELVVVGELSSVGWRLLLTQDLDEFEEPLAGPLQDVGTILVLALLAAGFVMTLVLVRRLRSAREEQARLARISEAQQELISIVSHELRTPVAGVLGFLETSLDHWDQMDDGQRRSAVSRAAANARRLQAMARDVLDTQSLETGQLVHAVGEVELLAEVRDAVEAQREQDAERSFEVELPERRVWVQADADRVQQVLANLLDNARKNAPAVAPIDVVVRVVDGQAEVSVTDRGPGITADARERIFDKFVRTRGESVTGTGLGLYISRQIVEAHGGRIWVDSDPGAGATFRFTLPLADGAERPSGEVVNT